MGRQSLTEIADSHGTAVVYMVTGGFEHLVHEAGGVFLGFSLRSTMADSLLVIRAEFPAGRMVAFVGAGSGAHCLSRAHKDMRNGSLKWRLDRFHNGEGVKKA